MARRRWIDSVAEALVRRRLRGLTRGALVIADGLRMERYGAVSNTHTLSETVYVHDGQFYGDVAFGGAIGAAEAYMQGYWSTNDLTTVMRILLQNRAVLDGLETGWARLAKPMQHLLHHLARNTRNGSRRNIQAHYDLGNDFFRLFLDPTLMYSSAVFERPGMTLEQASLAKLERICRKLELKPGDRVIEIGSGWGGFAIYAAQHYGCHVTTNTISPSQYALARERIDAAGLSDRIQLLLSDYRDLGVQNGGQYDKLVSIEMIEAVGYQYYETYFRQCGKLLKPDGLMLLQAITIDEAYYEAAKRSVDFIQRYIFPGSCIPSLGAMETAIARATDMRVSHVEDIGLHYAETLRRWRAGFNASVDAVRALGYPETFLRMWTYYLCYCEAGFMERSISDVQILLAKPAAQPGPVLPDAPEPRA